MIRFYLCRTPPFVLLHRYIGWLSAFEGMESKTLFTFFLSLRLKLL